jgi:hypothetical protein
MRPADPERTIPYGACAVSDEAFNHDEELARWLQEAGRRKWPRSPVDREVVQTCVSSPADAPLAPQATGYGTALLGLLALAYLEYFYADALLQIVTLRSLIVFVLPG